MKPIMESAVIKDGNKRVQYMIADTHGKPYDGQLGIWDRVDNTRFEELVKNNQVQFLVWENNAIKCRYTPEEIKSLGKRFNKEWIQMSQENYWSMDLTFKYKHIESASRCIGIACSTMQVTQTFNLYSLPITMYGNVAFMVNMINELGIISKMRLDQLFRHNGQDLGVFLVPCVILDKFIEVGRKHNMMFDTSTSKFYIKNGIETKKRLLFNKQGDSDKVLKMLTKLDRLTLENENKLGIV